MPGDDGTCELTCDEDAAYLIRVKELPQAAKVCEKHYLQVKDADGTVLITEL